jgi:hypothetical protein
MRPRCRALWILVCAGLALATACSAFAQATVEQLFFIQRSANANEVHYEARVSADGTLDSKDPVEGYWLDRSDGGSRKAISPLQKIAYGWSVEANGNNTYTLKLKAFADRPLTLIRVNGHWRAQLAIAGKQAYLARLYVATAESGGMPKVLYLDIFGVDIGSAAAVQERIVKN